MADGPSEPARREDNHRPGFDDTVWFRLDIGRRQNADPRWLLPLLCRRGHVTRDEIGAIRIMPAETMVQIPRAIAGRFLASVKRTAGSEGEDAIAIEPAEGGPAPAPQHRAASPRGRTSNAGPSRAPRYSARPTKAPRR